jgi:hypothetical protein
MQSKHTRKKLAKHIYQVQIDFEQLFALHPNKMLKK